MTTTMTMTKRTTTRCSRRMMRMMAWILACCNPRSSWLSVYSFIHPPSISQMSSTDSQVQLILQSLRYLLSNEPTQLPRSRYPAPREVKRNIRSGPNIFLSHYALHTTTTTHNPPLKPSIPNPTTMLLTNTHNPTSKPKPSSPLPPTG